MKPPRVIATAIATAVVIGAATASNAAVMAPVRVNETLPTGGDVENFLVVQTTPPAGPQHVVYRADQDNDNVIDLYSWLVDSGAAPVRLATIGAGKQVYPDIAATPDGSRIVYRADSVAGAAGHSQLYSVPTDGSAAPVTLTGAPGQFGRVQDFAIAPDGSRVVFRADKPGPGTVWGLYSQDLDNGSQPPVPLSDPANPGDVQAGYAISADSATVVYRMDDSPNTQYGTELYSLPIDGSGTQTKLNGALLSGSVEGFFRIAGSSRVVYRAAQDTAGVIDLYSTPIGASAPMKLNGSVPAPGLTHSSAEQLQITPDSAWAIYLATGPSGRREVFSSRVDGSVIHVRLNGDFAHTSGKVGSFEITPDGGLVVYRADLEVLGSVALYTRSPDGSSPNTRVTMQPADGLEVWDEYVISPDSQHVVFHAGTRDPASPLAIYAAPLDGSGPALLGDAPATSTHADNLMLQQSFTVTPDSRRVVYLSAVAASGVFEAYSRPIDGTGAPTKLSGGLVSGGDVTGHRTLADSSAVVYRADQSTDEQFELFLATWAVPTADDDTATTTSGVAGQIDVLANDHVAAGTLDPTSVTVTASPANGTAQPGGDGSIVYTPTAGFFGSDQFTYTVCATDDTTLCDNASVAVTVTASPSTAENDTAVTTAGIGIQIEVLANDGLVAGEVDPASVTVTTAPTHGTAVPGADGSITYTPAEGFWGTDQFTYQVCLVHDGSVCDTAIVAVTVGALAPTPVDDTVSTATGTPVDIAVLANDGVLAGSLDPTSVTVTVDPASGTAVPGASGAITYTPNDGFAGDDGFMYRVCVTGAPAACAQAVVSITVDAPPPTTAPPTTAPPTTAPPTTAPPTTAPPTTVKPPKPPKPPVIKPPVAPKPPTNPKAGYWLLEADGDLRAFGGAPTLTSVRPDLAPAASAVALAAQPGGKGLWVLASDGDIIARGSATDFGRVDLGALTKPGERVSTIAASPDGSGLWVFTTAGRILPFGTARPASQMAGSDAILALTLEGPIIDSVATPSGKGAFMVASDGGVFAVGDARFIDSVRGVLTAIIGPPGLPAAPVVGIVPDPDGNGYWNVATDGGVFAFGSPFRGSLPAIISADQLAAPVNGMVAYGNGYLLVAGDGGVFTFSDLPFAGSAAGTVDSTVVDIAARA